MKKIIVLKYPLRYALQILLVGFGIYNVLRFLNNKIIFDDLLFNLLILIITEIFVIVYNNRNKTYFIIDNIGDKFIIKRKNLKVTSKETRKRSEEYWVDRVRFDSLFINFVNLIDLVSSNKIDRAPKKIKEKLIDTIYSNSKYQIDSIKKVGVGLYKIILKNKKSKYLFVFNKLDINYN